MKRTPIALAGLLCVGLVGCSTTEIELKGKAELIKKESEIISETTFNAGQTMVIVRSGTQRELAKTREEFLAMPVEVQRAKDTICVNFYRGRDTDHFEKFEEAHYERGGSKDICIFAPRFRMGTLRHEMTHLCIDARGIDISPWTPLCELDARTSALSDKIFYFPVFGLLTIYSKTSPEEDIAEWAACVHLFAHGNVNVFRWVSGKKDPRYLAKLEWLLKEELISFGEYCKVKEEIDR